MLFAVVVPWGAPTAPSFPGAGKGGAYGTPGLGIMSPGLGYGNSSGRGATPGGAVPPGITIVEPTGGHGTGRPVTGSKQPSMTLPLLVSWHGGSDRAFELNQPVPHDDRHPVETASNVAPRITAKGRRCIVGLVYGGFGHPRE